MSVELHRGAGRLSALAEMAHREKRYVEARELYRQAALRELEVFAAVPVERRSARGVIAASTVYSLALSRCFEETALHAECYLRADLPEEWKRHIAALSQYAREWCRRVAERASRRRCARERRRKGQRRGR